MTPNELKRRFPKASEAFYAANLSNNSDASPKLECNLGNESLEKNCSKKTNSDRIKIIYSIFRRRLIDPENCCTKFHTDALRYEKIIKDDREQDVEIEVRQFKINSKAQERIDICIQYP